MRIQIVNLAVDDARGVEDAVAAMDHVVVERDHHQGGIGDHPSELAGIERGVLDGLFRAQRPQLFKHFMFVQHPKGGIGGGHKPTV